MKDMQKELVYAHKYVDLLSDAGFKIVFGEDGAQELLIPLFKVVFPDLDIVSLEYIEREEDAYAVDLKRPVCDVRCLLADGTEVIVEVQRSTQSYFFKRAYFESCLAYSGQLMAGQHYRDLRPVYVVCLLDFEMDHELRKDDDIVYRYQLAEELTGERVFHDLRLAFVELGRFKKNLEALDSFEDKLYFCLKNMPLMDGRPSGFDGDYFHSLFDRSYFAGLSKEKKTYLLESMLRERDIKDIEDTAHERGYKSGLEKGLEEGREEGLEKGLVKGREEGLEAGLEAGRTEAMKTIAQNMIASGYSPEEVSRLTGVSV